MSRNSLMPEGEHLVIPAGALVFTVDDSGDEKFNNREHPFLAFGGVAYVCDFRAPLVEAWMQMKARSFPQVRGPLHASRHLRDRASTQQNAVLRVLGSPHLARFAVVLSDTTDVPIDRVAVVALRTLANRFAEIAQGMLSRGFWRPPSPVIAIFEHSPRLTSHVERAFDGLALTVGEYTVPIEGCFMPKFTADPFLEMADAVVNTVTKCVKYQRKVDDPRACTPAFQSLFRDVGKPLASYIEVTAIQ